MRLLALIVGVLVAAGCRTPPAEEDYNHTPGPTAQTTEKTMTEFLGTLDVKLVGETFARPPRVEIRYDVSIVNSTDAALWYALPTKLTPSGTFPVGGVYMLRQYELTGDKGRAVLGTFLGTGGFHALRIPAGGKLVAHDIVASLWEGDEPLETVPMEIIIARRITIGGELADDWFSGNPIADPDSDVGEAKMTHKKQRDDLSEAPVEFDVLDRKSFRLKR